jgi:glutaredoxin
LKIGKIKDITLVIGQMECINCNKLKEYLTGKKIPFLYYDLNEIPAIVGKLIAITRKENGIKNISIPIIIYKNEMHVGFDDNTKNLFE